MLLAVDVGNSQTSYGVFKDGKLVRAWRSETRAARTADEFASLLFPLFAHAGLGTSWAGAVLCSVVPAVDNAFARFCRDYLSLEPTHLTPNSDLGFALQVDNPSEVGADRLANAAYAVTHLSLPAVVVDFGTATTFDLITRDGYQGGAILPGAGLSVAALSGGTAKLTSTELAFPPSVIGKSTSTCIQAGVLYGYCDMIDGLIDRMERELAETPKVILTGGVGPLFQARLKRKLPWNPDLTLEGIALLAKRQS